jgi:hypothetical protein
VRPEIRETGNPDLVQLGCAVSPDEIMITSGCQEAILLSLLTTCGPGDTAAVESPVFFNLLQMLRTFHIKVVEIPLHPRDGIIIEALRQAAEDYAIKACFASTNFSTPFGSRMPDENKEALVQLPMYVDSLHRYEQARCSLPEAITDADVASEDLAGKLRSLQDHLLSRTHGRSRRCVYSRAGRYLPALSAAGKIRGFPEGIGTARIGASPGGNPFHLF